MISIVIPAYNRIDYIGSTLTSIYQQKVDFKLDVIVVDDGSTDGTADWVENHFPSATVIRQPNRGVSEARNVGVSHAKGEIVAFCDSDDLMLPGRLSAQHAFLKQHSSAVIVAANFLDFNSKEGVARACRFNHANFGIKQGGAGIAKNFLETCIKVGNPLFSTGMLRKSYFLSLGGFAQGLRACEDFELRARLATLGDIGIIDKPLMLIRNDSQPRLSRSQNLSRPYESMVDYWVTDQVRLYREHVAFQRHAKKWAEHVVMQAYSNADSAEIKRLLTKYKEHLSPTAFIKGNLAFLLRLPVRKAMRGQTHSRNQ